MTGHDPYAPESGDASYGVESYDLTLDYRVRTNRLEGTAILSAVVAAEAVSSIAIDLVGLRASRVRVDGDRRRREDGRMATARVGMAGWTYAP